MTNAEARVFKAEALSFIFAGALFFAANLLTITLPKPPTAEIEFIAWLSEHKFQIAMHDEILFFAAISLIPAAMVLYKLFRNQQTFGSALGLGLMVMAIPVLAVLDIIEGRLVYPVYDIPLSFDALKLVFSILHGGLHAVSLIFGASIILLSYAMRAVLFTKAYWYFGLITGVLQIIGSYPWNRICI
jgi:hypothetical protein